MQGLGMCTVRGSGAGGPTGLHTAGRGHAGQWDEGDCTRAGRVYGEEGRGRGRGPWGLHKVLCEDRGRGHDGCTTARRLCNAALLLPFPCQ